MTKRVYKDTFIDIGFTCITTQGVSKPQCVICGEVLSNESMKANKLKRHLDTKHKEHSEKSHDYFIRKESELKRQRLDAPNQKGVFSLTQATLASYHVAWQIARCKKPHNIGEELIKPAALDMVRIVCGDDAAAKIESVPLSNSTIASRISDISDNIKSQLIQEIRNSKYFSLQLDETTDVSDDAQLLAYVRYQSSTTLAEEFLFCKTLTTTTTGADIFDLVDTFFTDEGIDWNRCISVCIDGAPAMIGARKGFVGRVKEINPDIRSVHCVLHRQNLASKRLSPELNAVMNTAVEIVNFIKSNAANSRLFQQMCKDYEATYLHLLYFSSIRWLSRGKMLNRMIDMRREIELFLISKRHPHCQVLSNNEWLFQLAYLADIFNRINSLNASTQGKNATVLETNENIQAFKAKLNLWKSKLENMQLASFPSLSEVLEENDAPLDGHLQSVMINHLSNLHNEFEKYFPQNETDTNIWILEPFITPVESTPEFIQEQLIDIQSSSGLKLRFRTETLASFWTHVEKDKPSIGGAAIKELTPFATTYLCESGFSTLAAIKTKYRNRLMPEADMRCALTTLHPEYSVILSTKQGQGSH